ncbi:hypothetical protein E4T48_00314 [Aureobasidium sp. EXF-10727]|nr:hypothetical protein E4T48_00314 [Aureobasidium sp. EXF-10727]KAI4729817.1 hypothetical protein E4T49_02367 [Aureobasidium sp. EXF-10728]
MAAPMDSTPPISLPQPSASAPIPVYLLPLLMTLHSITAISRSTPLTIFAIAYGVYWLFFLVKNKPQGQYTQVYTAGCTLISTVLRTISARFLMEEREFERRGEKGKDGEGKGGEPKRRGWLQWGIDVVDLGFMSARGIGWNFQIRNLPPAPAKTTPRLHFAAKQLLSAAFDFLLVDLAHHHHRHFSPIASEPIKSLTTQPLPLALLNAWLIYLQARWTMSATHKLLAAITVPLHIFSPSDFPPLFGSFAHAYTIKGFWAGTWHQMMRTLQVPYTKAFVRMFGLNEREKSTYWVKVCCAFFLAWLVHAYGTLIAGGGTSADFYRYAPQVFGFWIEEKVVQWGIKVGCKGKGWRVLGYVWVFCFQGATLVAWFGPTTKKGVYLVHPLGFSLLERVLG